MTRAKIDLTYYSVQYETETLEQQHPELLNNVTYIAHRNFLRATVRGYDQGYSTEDNLREAISSYARFIERTVR